MSKIKMNEFLNRFNEVYEKLYDDKISDDEELKAMKYFDNSMTDKQKKFLYDFIDYRKDYIASDRECKAFIIALHSYNYGFSK